MTGPRTLTFSSARRAPRRRWARTFGWLLGLVAVAVLVVAVAAGGLYAYAWARLGGDLVPAVADGPTVPMSAAAASSAGDVTTILVTTAPGDDAASAGPVALVQVGGSRTAPAALVLPPDLEVSADGLGTVPLGELQADGAEDELASAVADFARVPIDHVVVAAEDTLPQLVDHLGPVPVCAADGGCRELDADAVRRELDEADEVGRAALADAVLRGVAASARPQDLLRSPIGTKRSIDTLAAVRTDVGLRGTALLSLARALEQAPPLEVVSLPAVRNPDSGTLVLLPEQAEVVFQRFAGGEPLGDVDVDAEPDVREVVAEVPVAVLNGAGIDGLAGRVETQLVAEGFRVVGTGNAPAFEEGAATVVGYAADDPAAEAAAILLAEHLPDAELEELERAPEFEGEQVGVRVVAGADLDTVD